MRKFKRFEAIALAVAMVASIVPAAAGKANASGDYTFFNDYTLGWSGGIVAFQDGEQKTLADVDAPIFDNEDDRPFKAVDEQAWDTPNLVLTQPVKFTTNDGKANDIESMLTNWSFIADPTAIDNTAIDGKLYVYGTTEGFSYAGGKMDKNGYNNHSLTILSTSDMVNWTDEGTMDTQNLTNLPSDEVEDNGVKAIWATKAWAPSGLAYDGDGDGDLEYYLFHTNSGAVGYVVGDSPVGPWRSPMKTALFTQQSPNCSGVVWCFDPAVLVDDKGDAYCYFGGGTNDDKAHGKTGRVCKIKFNEDGEVEMDGEPQVMDTYYLFEDSEINQFNGKYYYSYCANFNVPGGDPWVTNGSIAVYVSSDPMNISFDPAGPDGDQFEDADGVYHHFLGTVLQNPSTIYGESYNNHHHMQSFKGRDYIFYHSTVLNNTIHKTNKQYRCLHVDEINVDAETDEITIEPSYKGADQIEAFNPYTDIHGNPVEINATTTSYSAGVCSRRSDERVRAGLSPMVLDEIDTGDWTKIQGVDFRYGTKKIEVVAGSATDDAAIEIFLDDPTKAANCVGKVQLKSTGDEDWFETFSADLTKTVTGKHDLYFVFRGTDYDVASWKFTEEPAPAPTATPGAPTVTPTPAPQAPAPTVAPSVDYAKNYTVGKNTVKVAEDGTATYVAPSKKTATSATIPATVTVEGKSYKVTSIAANAFKNCKKLKKVTIGKNVKSIGAKAFYGCKALKTVNVKSTVLKKVGKSSLKGTAAKLTVKVPKKQAKAYKKLFKKSGMNKKARVK